MCACSPAARARRRARTRAIASRRLVHREAELRVGLAGGDLLVRVAAHVGRDADEHRLRAPRSPSAPVGDQPLQALDLVEVVDHDQPDAVAQRHPQLGLGLGVAVQHDPLGREARVQRQVQLAAGGDVAPQALLREQRAARPCRGRPWRRTRRAKSSWPASRAGLRRTRAPARAGRPRRRRRRACRTRARARSCRSRRPPGAPRSFRRLPSGNTS